VRHFRSGVLKFINRNSGRAAKVALVDEKSGEVRDIRPQAGPC